MKSEWRTVKLLWFVNTLEGQTNTHTLVFVFNEHSNYCRYNTSSDPLTLPLNITHTEEDDNHLLTREHTFHQCL